VVNQDQTNVDEFIVVGGGIGGLAAALALARYGRQVRVLERAPEFTEVGAGIQLAPNATRVLRAWGLLESVLDVGIRPRRLVLSDAISGGELTSMDLGQAFLDRYGAPYVVLHRSDLLQILLEACSAEGVTLENDRLVTAVDSDADGADVTVAGGLKYRASVVIGADGLHSTLRRYLSDDEPVVSGFVAFRGARPLTEVKRHANLEEVQLYVAPDIHLIQYPVRSGNMYNQVAVFRSKRFFSGAEEWGTSEELYQIFANTCLEVRESVESLWSDQRWPMYDREPIGSWVSGRLVLLGDAAHPMLQYLAQGACQAFEDAAVLAESFRRLAPSRPFRGEELDRALAAYSDFRLPRTARAQRNARHWGDIWHSDGVAVLLRNELFARRAATDFYYADWLFQRAPGLSDFPDKSEHT
jgi:2-polyprenyl-6-methoxyphenol hydroxylase-like FAD-dependent oxidoreductase